jgi:putative phosphoesterase
MRLFVSSDPHLHDGNVPGGDEAVENLADYVVNNGTKNDVLLLLGDYGNSLISIRTCLSLFGNFLGRKLAVIGNHDLWDMCEDTNNRYLALQDLIESVGFVSLDRGPVIIGGTAFVGKVGWYDYSFCDVDVPPEALASKIMPGTEKICWNDALFVNWARSDQEVTAEQIKKLESELCGIKAERVIVGMHHVPTKQLLFHPRSLVPFDWRFANSFLGSDRFAKLFSRYSHRIEQVFCGHKHGFKTVKHDDISYTSIGGNYEKKELVIYDSVRKIIERMVFDGRRHFG